VFDCLTKKAIAIRWHSQAELDRVVAVVHVIPFGWRYLHRS
jgi:hypothetical protein